MRVLVVDDSPSIRTRLMAMLRDVPGVVPLEASGADEALLAMKAQGAEIVLLDLHMPGRSGLSVLPELKAMACRPVVVVLTNDSSEHHRREALARGADYFFDKAHDFSRVVDVVVGPTAGRASSDA